MSKILILSTFVVSTLIWANSSQAADNRIYEPDIGGMMAPFPNDDYGITVLVVEGDERGPAGYGKNDGSEPPVTPEDYENSIIEDATGVEVQ